MLKTLELIIAGVPHTIFVFVIEHGDFHIGRGVGVAGEGDAANRRVAQDRLPLGDVVRVADTGVVSLPQVQHLGRGQLPALEVKEGRRVGVSIACPVFRCDLYVDATVSQHIAHALGEFGAPVFFAIRAQAVNDLRRRDGLADDLVANGLRQHDREFRIDL